MTKEVLAKVTEPFFTTKERKVGTGLGLFIARTIVENHNGKLMIDSEVGKGTDAKVILPCCGEREKA
jgi:signal transduction histidine kinase